MPLYEFTCRHCAETFEELTKSSETGESLACPACGKEGANRRISTFASRVGRQTSACDTRGGDCATGSCCLNGACGL